MVAKCLASFERTLVSGNSPFDRFYYGGQTNAISDSAQRGFALFVDVCSSCHKMEDKKYATFSDSRFLNTGIAAISFTQLSDQGRWKVSGLERDRGAFRPPSLRNVALHAPYMHDGSLKTLEDVVRYYARGGNRNFWLTGEMPLGAPPNAVGFIDDLVNFLNSLTGEMPPNSGPTGQLP
jgi:cytochrome c peroxidase